MAKIFQPFRQQAQLGRFARAVSAVNDNEFSFFCSWFYIDEKEARKCTPPQSTVLNYFIRVSMSVKLFQALAVIYFEICSFADVFNFHFSFRFMVF